MGQLCILYLTIIIFPPTTQGYTGIRQWTINWCPYLIRFTKLPLSWLQLVVKTLEHSTKWTNQSKLNKVPKVVAPTNKKALL